MRTFLIIGLVCSSLHSLKGADQQSTNVTASVLETNLPICTISISGFPEQGKLPPICYVRLDTGSNVIRVSGLQLQPEMLFIINLFDAKGQRVEKTEYGKKFGHSLTQREINDWFQLERKHWGSGALALWFYTPTPSQSWVDVRSFSIPKAFKLSQAGDYTLHLQMRLIQTVKVDSSGTPRHSVYDGQYFRPDKSGQIDFQITLLPEVVSKVQIQPEDIASTNLPPNIPANSLTK